MVGVVVVVIAVVAGAEWLRQPSSALGGARRARLPRRPRRRSGPSAAGAAGVWWRASSGSRFALAVAQRQLHRDRDPLAGAARAAGRRPRLERLAGDLHAALHAADRLAQAALGRAGRRPRRRRSTYSSRLVPTARPRDERRGARFDRRRPGPGPDATAFRPGSRATRSTSRATGYYVVLEARRHSADGRTAVAGVLIWAHRAVPDRSRSLAELFRGADRSRSHRLPAAAPRPTASTSSTTRSRPPRAPGSSSACSRFPRSRARPSSSPTSAAAARSPGWCCSLVASRAESGRRPGATLRAAHGAALARGPRADRRLRSALQPLFSPATFFRPLLGPLSSSAGVLALAGTLLTIAGVWLWRRRLPRRWYRVAIGARPAARRALSHQQPGAGHHPAGRRRVGRALAHLAARHPGVGLRAARPDRGALPRRRRGEPPRRPDRRRRRHRVRRGGRGRGGVEPARRLARLVHVSLDAGTAPGDAARRRAGPRSAASRWWPAAPPRSSPGVPSWPARSRWRSATSRGSAPSPIRSRCRCSSASASRCARRRRPPRHRRCMPSGTARRWATRAIRPTSRSGVDQRRAARRAHARLARPAALAAVHAGARASPAATPSGWCQLARVPGVHYVLLVRLTPEEVMTASVGPRSELILPGRVGRLLDPGGSSRRSIGSPSRPRPTRRAELPRPRWRREGWVLRNEYPLHAAGRHPRRSMPRWICAARCRSSCAVSSSCCSTPRCSRCSGSSPSRWRGPGCPGRAGAAWLVRSASAWRPRWRLFFILPAVGFAAWSFARLSEEVRAEPRPADHPDAARRGDHRRWSAAGRRRRHRGAAAGAEPADRRRPRALSGRPARTAPARRCWRTLASCRQLMDPTRLRGIWPSRESWRSLGTVRSPSWPSGSATGWCSPGRRRRSASWPRPSSPTTPRSGPGSSTSRWSCCWRRSPAWRPRWRAPAAPRGRCPVRWPSCGAPRWRWARASRCRPHSERPPLEFEPVFGAFERMARGYPLQPERAGGGPPPHRGRARDRRDRRRGDSTPREGCIIANRQAVDLLGMPLEEGEPFLERLGPEWAPLAAVVERLPGGPRCRLRPRSWRSAGAGSRFSSRRSTPTCAAS